MIARELAELLMEFPDAEVYYEREVLTCRDIKTSITIYKDIFKKLDKYDNPLQEFSV